MGVILAEDQIDRVLLGAETALDSYVAADGRGTFRLSAHLVTATKPGQVADAGEYQASANFRHSLTTGKTSAHGSRSGRSRAGVTGAPRRCTSGATSTRTSIRSNAFLSPTKLPVTGMVWRMWRATATGMRL